MAAPPAPSSPDPIPAPVRPPGLYRLALAVAALAVLALAPLVFQTAAHWGTQRAFPYQLDAEEGFILNQAVTLARGGCIYGSLRQPPFVVGNYPPLFPWAYSLATGAQATLQSLPAGRLMIQLAAALSALLLGLIAGLRTRRWLPALLAPLLFFCSWEVAHWSAFVRVDFPALLFTAAGLGVFLTVRPRWGAALAALLFVAAGYARQTALLAPLACIIALTLNDRRRLAWFLIPYAGLGLAVLIWLQAKTGGEFLRHVVAYNQNVMDLGGLARVMKNEVWFFHRGLILALLCGAAARLFLRPAPGEGSAPPAPLAPRFHALPHARGAVSIYLALAALSLVSYGKVGAAPNYVLEPLAAAALWSAETLGLLLDRLALGARRVFNIAALGFCLLLLVHGAWLDGRALQFPWSAAPGPADRAAGYELLKALRAAPGDVYCEDPVYALLAGKPVLFQPFIMSQLAREGKWDARPFVDWLAARRFSLFAATADLTPGAAQDYERYTPAMAGALTRHYDPAGSLALPGAARQYFIWRPKTNPTKEQP